MRILTIAGILAFAIAGVVVMSSMRAEPAKKERVELDLLVDVIILEIMLLEDFFFRMRQTRNWLLYPSAEVQSE